MIEEELFRQLFFFLRQCLWLMQVVTSAGGVAARGLVNGRGPRWKRGRDLLPALVTTCNHIPILLGEISSYRRAGTPAVG